MQQKERKRSQVWICVALCRCTGVTALRSPHLTTRRSWWVSRSSWSPGVPPAGRRSWWRAAPWGPTPWPRSIAATWTSSPPSAFTGKHDSVAGPRTPAAGPRTPELALCLFGRVCQMNAMCWGAHLHPVVWCVSRVSGIWTEAVRWSLSTRRSTASDTPSSSRPSAPSASRRRSPSQSRKTLTQTSPPSAAPTPRRESQSW